jgi:hypothetical protein
MWKKNYASETKKEICDWIRFRQWLTSVHIFTFDIVTLLVYELISALKYVFLLFYMLQM